MAAAFLDETKAKNVLRQVEFYFSDSNLPRDKFLKKTVDESDDGLASLALICSFARMRTHLGLGEMKPEEVLEETVLAVAETLRKSKFLRVSEDGKRIGRSIELSKPEEVMDKVDSRTVAASPLPYDVKIEDVESFFGELGKVNSVRLPRLISDKRHFCGTALIEFSEEEDAQKVLNASMIYAGAELEIQPKNDFDAEREKMQENFERTHPNKDTSNESYPKGLIVAFKLKSTQPEDSTEQNGQEVIDCVEACKTDEVPECEGHANEADEKKSSENVEDIERKFAEDDEKGNGRKIDENCIKETNEKDAVDAVEESEVKVARGPSAESGEKKTVSADKMNVITREDLKKIFQKFGNVKYIDFRMGEESGYIRFEDADAAVKARAAAVLTDEGGFKVKNHIATLEALSGDAEKEYWSLLRGNQERFRDGKGGSNRGRGRGSKGGRRFDGKRQRQADSVDARSNKSHKVGTDK